MAIYLTYREAGSARLMHYAVAFDELDGHPIVVKESLDLDDADPELPGSNVLVLDRTGNKVTAWKDPKAGIAQDFEMADSGTLAAPLIGQLNTFPLIQGLRTFVLNWHVSHVSVQAARVDSALTVDNRLSPTGNNIASVLSWLQKQAPDRLAAILAQLRRDVPNLATVAAEVTDAQRLRLAFQDAPFEQPFQARQASDGTLTLLAHLLLLQGGEPYSLLCLDEPENNLHPRLMPDLAESCRAAAERSQVIVATHSPEFLWGVRAEELRGLYRDADGFTQAVRAADIRGVPEFLEAGASLGQLWLEGHFGVGDPLVNHGWPQDSRGHR